MSKNVCDPTVVLGICNRLRIAPKNMRQSIVNELVDYALGQAGEVENMRNDLLTASPSNAVVISRKLRELRGHGNLFTDSGDRLSGN